jgi:hypothetical protein
VSSPDEFLLFHGQVAREADQLFANSTECARATLQSLGERRDGLQGCSAQRAREGVARRRLRLMPLRGVPLLTHSLAYIRFFVV